MTDSTQAAAAPETTTSAAEPVQSDAVVAPAAEVQAPAAEAPADAGQPVEYADFSVPEGLEIDADVLGSFKGIAQELGISQESAQKLIDLQAGLVQKQADATQAALAAQAQQWADSVKADKEIGGERYAQTVETAAKAVEKFGSPELRTLLNESGLGNHPELVKFCHRIGQALSEDSMVQGGTQNGAKSLEERLWGGN